MPGKMGAPWGPLTCMVTTPSSSAASLRIWLASTCASSRMEKSAWATAPSSQHATRQDSQRDGRSAPAPARPGKPRQPRARAAAPARSSSSGSRAMLPPPTPRRRAPGSRERATGGAPRARSAHPAKLSSTGPDASARAAAASKLRGRPATARERGRPPSPAPAAGGRGSGPPAGPRDTRAAPATLWRREERRRLPPGARG